MTVEQKTEEICQSSTNRRRLPSARSNLRRVEADEEEMRGKEMRGGCREERRLQSRERRLQRSGEERRTGDEAAERRRTEDRAGLPALTDVIEALPSPCSYAASLLIQGLILLWRDSLTFRHG